MSSDLADPMHTEGLDDYDLLALVPGEWDAIIDAGCNPTEIMSMSIVNVIHNSDRIRRIIYAQNSNGCMFIFRGDGLGKHSIIDAIIDNARKVGWGRWERLGPSTWHCEQASGSYNLKVVVKNKDTGPEYDGSNHDLVLNGQFNQEDPADLDEGTLRGMYLRTISPNILIMSQQPLKAQLPTQATPQPWIKDIPNNAIARGYVRNPDHLPEGTELYMAVYPVSGGSEILSLLKFSDNIDQETISGTTNQIDAMVTRVMSEAWEPFIPPSTEIEALTPLHQEIDQMLQSNGLTRSEWEGCWGLIKNAVEGRRHSTAPDLSSHAIRMTIGNLDVTSGLFIPQ